MNRVSLTVSVAVLGLSIASTPTFARDNNTQLTSQDMACAAALGFCQNNCEIVNKGYDALIDNCKENCGFDSVKCTAARDLVATPQSKRPRTMGPLPIIH